SISWWIPPRQTNKHLAVGAPVEAHLDLAAMDRAASLLLGTHDFRAFRSSDDERSNTVRTLRAIRLLPGYADAPDGMALEFEGDAFMKNMVRILVGTLVEVGRGRLAPESVVRM